jgi:hypothetical protein
MLQYPWIETEKQFFGQRGTDYDFEGQELNKAEAKLRKLQDEQQGLAKKINKKVRGAGQLLTYRVFVCVVFWQGKRRGA